MSVLRAWFRRLGGLFGIEGRDRELAAELESHLQLHIDDNLRAGMSPEEARRDALVKFGGLERAKENYRARRGIPWLETLLQDVRFALRMLRKNPGFTAVAILTLALGIGANTAIFSVVDTVLLRPLPFKNPSRLVWAWGKFQHGSTAAISAQDFLDYRSQNHVFERLDATVHGNTIFNLAGDDGPEQVKSTIVTSGFFQTLGIEPLLGRTFLQSDEEVSDPQVAVLSHNLWQERFGADSTVIGRSVTMDGHRRTIVGVLRAAVPFFPDVDVWLPVPFRDPEVLTRQAHFLRPIGLLKPGVNLTEAQAGVDAIAARLSHDYADTDSGWSLILVPLQTALIGEVKPALLVFVGVVALVLLIACVNVASLLLARNSTREREIAVRMALGAGRSRLIRQMLTESVLLAAAGAVAGIFVAHFAIELLKRFGPQGLPRIGEVSVSGGVLGITFGVAILTGILCA